MSSLINFMMIGTNDLEKSAKFYDAIFVPLGIIKASTTERHIGYAQKNNPEETQFYICKPFNKEQATNGNGTMIALLADTNEAVDKFHTIALENGGTDEGSPGIRYDGNYYAYIRDPDGNKICARCNSN
tara:strand:+ start:87 stop:473 length:387 start_codon:yes stop_codon:yes gene_type:complete